MVTDYYPFLCELEFIHLTLHLQMSKMVVKLISYVVIWLQNIGAVVSMILGLTQN